MWDPDQREKLQLETCQEDGGLHLSVRRPCPRPQLWDLRREGPHAYREMVDFEGTRSTMELHRLRRFAWTLFPNTPHLFFPQPLGKDLHAYKLRIAEFMSCCCCFSRSP